jgi:hypothetical protein
MIVFFLLAKLVQILEINLQDNSIGIFPFSWMQMKQHKEIGTH